MMHSSLSSEFFPIILLLMSTEIFCGNVTSIDVNGAETIVKVNGNMTLSPSSIKVLNQILKNLEDFGDHRIKELDSLNAKQNKLSIGNFSLSDQILSLRDGLSSMKPIKKTFGYKVTVYRSPTSEEKPMVFKEFFDSEEPLNDTNNGDLSSSNSNSHHSVLPVPSGYISNSYEPKNVVHKVGEDHGKKFEKSLLKTHHHDKGVSEGKSRIIEHDAENHGSKFDNHHHQENQNSHNIGEYAHNKGAATETGIRERTQIEFFEKEHFLDTEHDKAKGGHENLNGHSESKVQDKHLSQQQQKSQGAHDSHSRHKHHEGTVIGDPQYSDIKGHLNHYGHRVANQQKDHLVAAENAGRSHHSNQESSKHSDSHGKHLSQDNNEDRSYYNKDKGRTKEGYRERGYKITTEREYFLKDAHHDNGFGKHDKGHQASLLDKGRHGSEGGERHRDFKKELQHHDAHDIASDKKAAHHHGIQQHRGINYLQDGDHHPQAEYLQSSSSGNHVTTQKREGELPVLKNTKCKTCCRKYAQAENFTAVITPRRIGDQQNSTETKLHKINVQNPISNREIQNKSNFLRPNRHQAYLNNRRRIKGKITRLRIPSKYPRESNSTSNHSDRQNLHFNQSGFQIAQRMVHSPQENAAINKSHRSIVNFPGSLALSKDDRNPRLKNSGNNFKTPNITQNKTEVRNNARHGGGHRVHEAFPKYRINSRLKYHVYPIPFLTLYGVTGKSLRYVHSKRRDSIPVTKMPVSVVKYVDDDDDDDDPQKQTERPLREKLRLTMAPKIIDGTYGAKINGELPTYRDDPNYHHSRMHHQPVFVVTSPPPDETLIGANEDHVVSHENINNAEKYSQPLLSSGAHVKHGIWYPEKLEQ